MPNRRSWVGDRFSQRRSCYRRQFQRPSCRRISSHYYSGRIYVWHALRNFLLWPRLERADFDQTGLRVRASDQGTQSAAVFSDGKNQLKISRGSTRIVADKKSAFIRENLRPYV